jgi:1,4-dihydroxy-2-naphthoate octaprenyltransferase
MLTLVRISTGEDWQNLMYACYPCWIGSGFAVIYFVSFVFFAMFILLVRTSAVQNRTLFERAPTQCTFV